MDKQVKNRVKQAMDQLSISAYAIAKSCSINERTIYEQTNGSSKIGTSVLAALLAYCPQLSAEWLLRGAGDMLISSVVPTERTPREHRETTERTPRDDRETTEQITKDQPRTNQGSTKDEPATEDSSDAALKEKIEELLNTTLAAYKEKIDELQYIIDLQTDYIDGNKNTIAQLEDFIKHLKAENHELKKAQHTVTVPHAKSV